jgi:Spy/CpxP family protein refolding chaperone
MNMKSIRNLLAGTVLATGALLAAGATISIATAADEATTTPPAPGGPHGGWHHHGGPMHLYSQLGLSDAQKAQIKTIFQSAGPQMKTIHEQMRTNSLKLAHTQPTDGNYSSVVAEVSQANATLHAQMTTHMATVRQQIYTTVLNEAQRTQLQTLEAQREARMQQRMQSREQGANSN